MDEGYSEPIRAVPKLILGVWTCIALSGILWFASGAGLLLADLGDPLTRHIFFLLVTALVALPAVAIVGTWWALRRRVFEPRARIVTALVAPPVIYVFAGAVTVLLFVAVATLLD